MKYFLLFFFFHIHFSLYFLCFNCRNWTTCLDAGAVSMCRRNKKSKSWRAIYFFLEFVHDIFQRLSESLFIYNFSRSPLSLDFCFSFFSLVFAGWILILLHAFLNTNWSENKLCKVKGERETCKKNKCITYLYNVECAHSQLVLLCSASAKSPEKKEIQTQTKTRNNADRVNKLVGSEFIHFPYTLMFLWRLSFT